MVDVKGNKRLLRADEIECRVGQKSKDKSKYSVLLYKTARTDMAILDEVFGWENWQSEHYQVKDKDFCRISVRLSDGTWISKSDCGDETNVEARKGESSDAMKRAGVQFGIGRELYSAPTMWLSSEINEYSLKVERIAYDATDKISELQISGYKTGERESNRTTVFSFDNGKTFTLNVNPTQGTKNDEPKKEIPDIERIRDIAQSLELDYGKDINGILAYYNAKTIGEISLKKWENMLESAKGNA